MKFVFRVSGSRYRTGFAVLASLLFATGCNPGPPRGQVIAIVNGEEITIAELNEEARARNVGDAGKPSVRNILLRDMIDRKLLVQEAIRNKLDRSRQYLIASKRVREVLLAQQLFSTVDAVSTPRTSADVRDYSSTGQTSDKRTIFTVDQITFSRFSSPKISDRLRSANTIDEIQQILLRSALPGERAVKTWDSVLLSQDLIGRLLATRSGKPFLLPYGDVLIAGQVLSSVDQFIEAGQRVRLADERLIGERRADKMRRTLQSSRAGAKISYGPGYDPPSE